MRPFELIDADGVHAAAGEAPQRGGAHGAESEDNRVESPAHLVWGLSIARVWKTPGGRRGRRGETSTTDRPPANSSMTEPRECSGARGPAPNGNQAGPVGARRERYTGEIPAPRTLRPGAAPPAPIRHWGPAAFSAAFGV
ncbi:hypothetical protein YTPLAS18_12700 [Nitrospira sp.]|nr:hypothetical protein YTPLAS18_12700 [Nitrospira sp.]